jgi:hypothetical protein
METHLMQCVAGQLACQAEQHRYFPLPSQCLSQTVEDPNEQGWKLPRILCKANNSHTTWTTSMPKPPPGAGKLGVVSTVCMLTANKLWLGTEQL